MRLSLSYGASLKESTTQPEDAPTQQVPDAKLIIKFYDESGNFVESKEQTITSRAASEWENLRSNLVASQNGEIEVSIVNNDTSIPVYFDNLKIQVLGDEKPLVLQENHYYPFGMNMKGIENEPEKYHKFQYNGKEKQTELGLHLVDYGQRMHDTQLGRFHKVDRFAEKYSDLSGYNYTANNPIKYIDVNGDSIWVVIPGTNNEAYYWGKDKNGNYNFIGQDGEVYQGNYQFVADLSRALTNIMNGRAGIGKAFIEGLAGEGKHVRIYKLGLRSQTTWNLKNKTSMRIFVIKYRI